MTADSLFAKLHTVTIGAAVFLIAFALYYGVRWVRQHWNR